MTCPDIRIQPEEPPPAAAFGPFARACRDCANCHDGGSPHKPEQWVCVHHSVISDERLCYIARNEPTMCGIGAKWFADALGGR